MDARIAGEVREVLHGGNCVRGFYGLVGGWDEVGPAAWWWDLEVFDVEL